MRSRQIVGGVLVGLLLLTLPVHGTHVGVTSASDWPQFHGDAALDGVSSGSSPGGGILYTVNLSQYAGGRVSNPLGNDFPYQASPSTDGSQVYVALNNVAIALTAATGKPQWESTLPGGNGSGPAVGTPLVANGRVYLDQDGGPNEIAAYYSNNGTLAWFATTPGGGSPASASLVESNGVIALADLAGGFSWTSGSGGGVWTSPSVPAKSQFFATPSFGTVAHQGPAWIVPDRGNRSLDAWSTSGSPLSGFPVASGQRLDRLYSSAALVNLTSVGGGSQTWAFFGGEGGQGNPSHLYAVDASAPSGVYSLALPALGSGDTGVRSTPAVTASGGIASVYLATRTGAVSEVGFNPASTGNPWSWKWNATTGGPVDASPVLVGGELIVPSEDGSVYAFAVGGGNLLWKVSTGAPIYGSPAVANGICWVINAYGVITAINGNGPGSPGNPLGPGVSPIGIFLLVVILAVIAAVVVIIVVVIRYDRRHRQRYVPTTAVPPPNLSGGPAGGPRP